MPPAELDEIQRSICAYSDSATLCTLAKVCKQWRLQSERDEFWTTLCQHQFKYVCDVLCVRAQACARACTWRHTCVRASAWAESPVDLTPPPITTSVTPSSFVPPPDPVKRLFEIQRMRLRQMLRNSVAAPGVTRPAPIPLSALA